MDLSVIFQAVSLVLGAIGAILLYKTLQLNAQLNKITLENERMRDYGRRTMMLTYDYVDAVLLGPRYSGKSSILQLWSSPWANVHDIAQSAKWTTHEFSLHEFDVQKRYDDVFQMEREYEPVLRIRVQDYPGEDKYRVRAIRDIKALGEKVVLVLLFRVGFQGEMFAEASANASYFSKAFLDEIETLLDKLDRSIARVIVVFNKSDLAPEAIHADELLTFLKDQHKQTIQRLEAVFGGVIDYVCVSAVTNYNVVKLLGMIASTAIQAAGEDEKLELALKAIEARIRKSA